MIIVRAETTPGTAVRAGHVLGIIDLVEECFFIRSNIHADGEEIAGNGWHEFNLFVRRTCLARRRVLLTSWNKFSH